MKLIDKDALVAEIERKKEEEVNYDDDSKSFASYADHIYYIALDSMQDFIDTLEVKEVNLEKKIMEKTSLENKIEFWSECKGKKQPTIRKCNGCPMFTVHNEKPTCLYGR